LEFSITTKSVLILRDLDLLVRVSAKHRFSVHIRPMNAWRAC
jgi:DNA repair photolyase